MKKPDIKIVEVVAIIIGGLSLIFMDKPTPVLIGKITVVGGIMFALWLILPFKTLKDALARMVEKLPKPLVYMFDGIVIGIVLMIAVYIGYQKLIVERSVDSAMEEQTEAIKSIAVLAFEDMSPDKDQEWFCDGISEAIITAVSYIEDLKVTSRTSSFMFKGNDTPVREIGQKLGVETVLEGSVLKSGNRLRITAQLIKTSDGFHLWSKQFDLELKDVFAIHEAIALAIVDELKLKPKASITEALDKRPTEDMEAYDYYLLGNFYLRKREHEKSLEYFMKAIERDSNFALAHAGIASIYNNHGYHTKIPSKRTEFFSEARKAIKKALSIDSSLAEGYAERAWLEMYYDWDWDAAKHDLETAITLNPGNDNAHRYYRDYWVIMGKWENAMEKIERALELDPL